jgi:hypothetical protein
MAARWEVQDVKAGRDEWDARLRAAGHAMTWKLGPNATRKGHCYHWVGLCGHCGAGMTIGRGFTTCSVVRDAREEPCSGPGTAILTEIEAQRVHDLVAGAVAEFGAQVSETQAAARRPAVRIRRPPRGVS